MKKSLKLEELSLKSFQTSPRNTVGGTTPPTEGTEPVCWWGTWEFNCTGTFDQVCDGP